MQIQETVHLPRAKVRVHVERAYDYDEKRGLWVYRQEEDDEEALNILTNTGRVQLHKQCYSTTPGGNGFNWIGLTNDAAAPAASDTALAAELTGNGLDRAQGSVTPPTGSGNQTTITHLFTYLGVSQQVQKTALFDSAGPPVAGIMNHEIAFVTPRTLLTNDTLTLTFTITLG